MKNTITRLNQTITAKENQVVNPSLEIKKLINEINKSNRQLNSGLKIIFDELKEEAVNTSDQNLPNQSNT